MSREKKMGHQDVLGMKKDKRMALTVISKRLEYGLWHWAAEVIFPLCIFPKRVWWVFPAGF